MQTGNISFCDKIGMNIKSEEFKQLILNQLEHNYGLRILNKHFETFKHDTSVEKMQKNPYMFCLKSNGNPYFMYLTKVNNVNTCIMIDKKIQQGYFLPRMIIVHQMFDDKLFTNTLFDGEMVKDKSKTWIYLINDIYVNCNEHLSDTNLIKRHNILYKIFENMYKDNELYFKIQIKKLFHLSEISIAVNEFQHKLNYTTRGILFKPLFIKFRDILYNFDDSLVKHNTRVKLSNINEFTEKKVISERILTIKNTQTPDIYNLYDKNEHVGNACVNSLTVSKFCYNLFKNTSLQDAFLVKCTYNSNFNKWTPVALVQ